MPERRKNEGEKVYNSRLICFYDALASGLQLLTISSAPDPDNKDDTQKFTKIFLEQMNFFTQGGRDTPTPINDIYSFLIRAFLFSLQKDSIELDAESLRRKTFLNILMSLNEEILRKIAKNIL